MLMRCWIAVVAWVLSGFFPAEAGKPRRLLHGLPETQGPKIIFDEREMRVNHRGAYIRPIVVPVVRQSTILGYLVFAPILMPQRWQDLPSLVAMVPRLRDALFCEIYELFGKRWTTNARLDPNQLLAHVGRCVQKHAQDGLIANVSLDRVQFYKMIQGESADSLFSLSAWYPDPRGELEKTILLR